MKKKKKLFILWKTLQHLILLYFLFYFTSDSLSLTHTSLSLSPHMDTHTGLIKTLQHDPFPIILPDGQTSVIYFLSRNCFNHEMRIFQHPVTRMCLRGEISFESTDAATFVICGSHINPFKRNIILWQIHTCSGKD